MYLRIKKTVGNKKATSISTSGFVWRPGGHTPSFFKSYALRQQDSPFPGNGRRRVGRPSPRPNPFLPFFGEDGKAFSLGGYKSR